MIITGSSLRWLLFLLVPYFIGMVIHFMVPFYFMLDSFPKSENVYNSYKLQAQQNSVRTLALLKQKIISSRMQLWWRSGDLFTKIYKQGNPFMTVDQNKVQLRYALNVTGKESNLDISMWFAPQKSKISQLDSNQRQIISKYIQAQPFLRATVPSNNQKSLPIFTMTMNYSGSPMLLFYPTRDCKASISGPNVNIYKDQYNQTKSNWFSQGIQYTAFVGQKKFKLCSSIIEGQLDFTGVLCSQINLQALAYQLNQLGEGQYNSSTNTYYLLSPIYSHSGPRVLFKFTDGDIENVKYPLQDVFEIPPQVSSKYWQPKYTQYGFVQFQLSASKSMFLSPIQIPPSKGVKVNIMFLMIESQYNFANFNNADKIQKLLLSILTPSVALIIFFLVGTICIVRCTLKSMENDIDSLQIHCKHILQNGLDVQLPQYRGSKEISDLYDTCRELNSLYKVSHQSFFSGSYAQRYLLYFQVYQYFKKIGYDYIKIIQILGNCQFNLKNFQQACKHYKECIQVILNNLKEDFGSLEIVYRLKQKRSKKLETAKYRQVQLILKSRLFKYLYSRFCTFKPGAPFPDFQQYTNLYKKINYNHANAEICFVHQMVFLYQLTRGQMQAASKSLKKVMKFTDAYQKKFYQGKTQEQLYELGTHPDIVRSSLQYYCGVYSQATGNKALAMRYYRSALQKKMFNIQVHNLVINQIKTLLKAQKMLTKQVLETCYFNQDNLSTQRQYILLFDWTKPSKSSSSQMSAWKKSMIQKAYQVFDKFVASEDRFSLVKFDNDVNLLCSLTYKNKNQALLKRHIDSLNDYKPSKVITNVSRALDETFSRVKNLPLMKIFIFFLKNQAKLSPKKIKTIIEKSEIKKIMLIFIKEDISADQKDPQYFIFSVQNKEDLQRVLGRKPVFQFNNEFSPF